jgi:hypothetical protein
MPGGDPPQAAVCSRRPCTPAASSRVACVLVDVLNSRVQGAGMWVATLLLVSQDLYFWPSGATRNPRRLAERLADE